MNYIGFLRSLQKGDKTEFETDVEDQKRFLYSLKEPKDDYDRSLKQYLCQNYFISYKIKIRVLNIVSFIFVPFAVFVLVIKRIACHHVAEKQAIMTFKGMPEVVPDSLRNKYNIFEVSYDEGASLSFLDLGFILKMQLRFVRYPYFVFKNMMKIACYSVFIKKYAPKAIITFGEYSFTSSVLTSYCHSHNVKHIDVMHGEKTFFIRDSFFHFDECYVWDKHYVELFKKLRADEKQFHVEIPPSIRINCEKYYNKNSYADVKYYLAVYTENELVSIISQMELCKEKGLTIKYRPHPRYSDMILLKKYVSMDEIEDTKNVPITESISSLKYAVGSCSTVLTQAYFSGITVVLDDVAYEKQYHELIRRDYILASYNLTKLSDFVN